MKEITICQAPNCPLNNICKRFAKQIDINKSEKVIPIKIKNDQISCEYFIYNNNLLIESFKTKELFSNYLNIKNKTGYLSGGSGHLSFIQYNIFHLQRLNSYNLPLYFIGYEKTIESEFSTTTYKYFEIYHIAKENKFEFINKLYEEQSTHNDNQDFDPDIQQLIN